MNTTYPSVRSMHKPELLIIQTIEYIYRHHKICPLQLSTVLKITPKVLIFNAGISMFAVVPDARKARFEPLRGEQALATSDFQTDHRSARPIIIMLT